MRGQVERHLHRGARLVISAPPATRVSGATTYDRTNEWDNGFITSPKKSPSCRTLSSTSGLSRLYTPSLPKRMKNMHDLHGQAPARGGEIEEGGRQHHRCLYTYAIHAAWTSSLHIL
jgi:hypothetical protein